MDENNRTVVIEYWKICRRIAEDLLKWKSFCRREEDPLKTAERLLENSGIVNGQFIIYNFHTK